MNFNTVKSVAELRQQGSLEEVIASLNEQMHPFKVQEHIDTFESLWPFVQRAKQVERYEPDSFFVSKKHEYTFYLTQLRDTKDIRRLIGLKDEYFEPENINKAKKWYKTISLILKASSVSQPVPSDVTAEAQTKLTGYINNIKRDLDRFKKV
ncbi:hypothetical protein [Vibrio vulnificus]|uniref:hypothetical protein n=1 Tax=Vibrio vulnificus TaxID=672 RepID=UPI00215BBD41|nr:hypothetical protein [Vibrio vulnificus]MCR9500905.1 hypothetical protein [Vibrio vulnificus]